MYEDLVGSSYLVGYVVIVSINKKSENNLKEKERKAFDEEVLYNIFRCHVVVKEVITHSLTLPRTGKIFGAFSFLLKDQREVKDTFFVHVTSTPTIRVSEVLELELVHRSFACRLVEFSM